MSEYFLSQGALAALSQVLRHPEFIDEQHSMLLDDVAGWLNDQSGLPRNLESLRVELHALPDEARESMSRALAAALATSLGGRPKKS